jgi:hypothetical protein
MFFVKFLYVTTGIMVAMTLDGSAYSMPLRLFRAVVRAAIWPAIVIASLVK